MLWFDEKVYLMDLHDSFWWFCTIVNYNLENKVHGKIPRKFEHPYVTKTVKHQDDDTKVSKWGIWLKRQLIELLLYLPITNWKIITVTTSNILPFWSTVG